MGKTLRVCLAMGGGVSLGSFSGSALTEALKLLILYGKDSEGNPYDKVIVDGMSGASAGAIALTIMLRCLIDYKSMISLLGEGASEQLLIEELAKDYFKNDKAKVLAHKNSKSLIALQLAQKIQYKIWVEEVDSVKLYGKKIAKNYVPDPNKSFSLLDRGHLEGLAKKYLIDSPEMELNNRVLLDEKRVVFACSLTNLLPIQIDDLELKTNKLEKNILKSTGSDNHSELRVIDFVFDKTQSVETDNCWLRFCNDPEPCNPTNFNITSRRAWSIISASALACGAFPIAFEPVLLKRYQKEFGGSEKGTTWPKSFIEIQKEINKVKCNKPECDESDCDKPESDKTNNIIKENSFFGESDNTKLDYKSFNFPYIDGGTFNNEPIREAFKIGTFQDFGRDIEQEERLVLFVDPIVRKEHHRSFKVSSFSPVKSANNKTDFKSELSKLLGNVSNILSVLVDQGSIKEEHKIIDTKENFKLRKTIFDYLNVNTNISENLNIDIISTAFNKVTRNLRKGVISVGTREPIFYLIEQIRKSCRDQRKHNYRCIEMPAEKLFELKEKIDKGKIKDIKEVYSLLELAEKEDQNAFAQAIFKVITDFSLNTDGKSERNYKAAIMPVNEKLDIIELPGVEIEAFGGFASLKARQYSFEFAKLSTLFSLKEENGFRVINKIGMPFIVGSDLKDLKETITKSVKNINFFDGNDAYSKNLEVNLFIPSLKRVTRVLINNKILRFSLLKIPFVLNALITSALLPLFSLIKEIPWRGKSIVKNLIKKGANQVKYIALEPVTLSILSDTKLDGKFSVKCEGEKKSKKIKVIKHVLSAFDSPKRYQYLFKVSLAEFNKDDIKEHSMSLTLSNKVKLTTNIDRNLEINDTIDQKKYDRLIEEFHIVNYDLPSIKKAINDRFSMLHYSFKNINYHVNPVVEIDLQQLEKGWYFKEQTESLDKKMLN